MEWIGVPGYPTPKEGENVELGIKIFLLIIKCKSLTLDQKPKNESWTLTNTIFDHLHTKLVLDFIFPTKSNTSPKKQGTLRRFSDFFKFFSRRPTPDDEMTCTLQ